MIRNWLIDAPLGKALVVVAQVIISLKLAHTGHLRLWGASVSMDPDKLALGILGVFHWVWAEWRHKLKGS